MCGVILLHTHTHLHTLVQALDGYVHVYFRNVPIVKESAADRVNRSFCITSSRVLSVKCHVMSCNVCMLVCGDVRKVIYF